MHIGCIQIFVWSNLPKIGNNPNGKTMARQMRYKCTDSFREFLLKQYYTFFLKFISINTDNFKIIKLLTLSESYYQKSLYTFFRAYTNQ